LGKIINLPYNEMESFSLGLITVITPIISALADYGALPADLTAASAARTAYLAVQTKPQVDKAERKVQNSNIHPFIVEAKKILTEQCDPIASTLLRDHPDTYKLWFDARDVKDLPHGTTVVEGYAYKSDGVTGLYNVNIIFREQNIQTKTFLDGYYRVTHFPHGVANPVATIGEVSQRSDPFEVKMGHTVHHDFILPI